MELTEIVRGLEPRLLETLEHIHITFDGSLAEAVLSFHLYGPPSIGKRVGPYSISVDTDNLPEGVSVSGFERYPDRVVEVSTTTPMEDQIRALHASGLVGGLDAARFGGGAEAVRQGVAPASWIVKTHAASQAERLAWLQALQRQQHSPREDETR